MKNKTSEVCLDITKSQVTTNLTCSDKNLFLTMPDNSLIQQIFIKLLPCARYWCSDSIVHITFKFISLPQTSMNYNPLALLSLNYCLTASKVLQSQHIQKYLVIHP